MGLVSLYIGFAAASLALQVPQNEQLSGPAQDRSGVRSDEQTPEQAREQAGLPAYRLPVAPGTDTAPPRGGARKDTAYPRIEPPDSTADPVALPSVDWWQGSAAIKMRVVGVHFGWDF